MRKIPIIIDIKADYGGNASGKTNLFKALSFVKGLVVKGTQPNSLIPVEPFRLDAKKGERPTHFSLELLVDETIYSYIIILISERKNPMPQFKTLMEILKLLEKSNCRKCDEKTCMAFAAAVFKGDRPLSDCPQIAPEVAQLYGNPSNSQPNRKTNNELDVEQQLAELHDKLMKIDFVDAAQRINAAYDGTRLVFKIMGKDFRVDPAGNIYTDIHVHPWITIPIFNYILYCKGAPVKNEWVPLRELPSGKTWYRLFGQRCEKPMKRIADSYPDLFTDLVDIFNGQSVDNHYQSDVALILHPLPLIPLLICYWRAEEGLASNLNLFFDASAEDNLGIDGIYALSTGITRMFEKLALRHG